MGGDHAVNGSDDAVNALASGPNSLIKMQRLEVAAALCLRFQSAGVSRPSTVTGYVYLEEP
jgi:hypothetical protein